MRPKFVEYFAHDRSQNQASQALAGLGDHNPFQLYAPVRGPNTAQNNMPGRRALVVHNPILTIWIVHPLLMRCRIIGPHQIEFVEALLQPNNKR
jgi:hypothetical protein